MCIYARVYSGCDTDAPVTVYSCSRFNGVLSYSQLHRLMCEYYNVDFASLFFYTHRKKPSRTSKKEAERTNERMSAKTIMRHADIIRLVRCCTRITFHPMGENSYKRHEPARENDEDVAELHERMGRLVACVVLVM